MELAAPSLGNSMDGHAVHSWQQIRPEGLWIATKLHFLVNPLLKEDCLIWSLWSALGVVPCERPFPIMGIGNGPCSNTVVYFRHYCVLLVLDSWIRQLESNVRN